MGELLRFGVSMDAELLAAFDRLIEQQQYGNRSEAIRDLVRAALVQTRWERGRESAAAAVVLQYDPTANEPARRLGQLQRRRCRMIVSRMQVQLGPARCFEVLALKGKAADVQTFADQLIATRGVLQGQLVPAVGQ